MLHEEPRHEAGGVPSTGDQAAERASFGRSRQMRWLPSPNSLTPIGDRTQKWHSGIHCLNARLSRDKRIGTRQTILDVMSALGQTRSSDGVCVTSALPPKAELTTDIVACRRCVPIPEVTPAARDTSSEVVLRRCLPYWLLASPAWVSVIPRLASRRRERVLSRWYLNIK